MPTPRAMRPSAVLMRSAVSVLLGLSGRRTPPAERGRRSAASSFEAPIAAANELQFGRAYWLPPFGRGNGLEALFWAPIAQVPAGLADPVLEALAAEDIAAWAAPARGADAEAGGVPQDLWVASAELDAAQDVLMRVLRS
ncbi:MAG TPA: hypothetical protein VIG76_06145 [Amnibacterium sp.]|uniref:hypothetical protein n=1 Tax=Amnibacterium sp. TaxID=1872496 RepID=UPI002F93B75F